MTTTKILTAIDKKEEVLMPSENRKLLKELYLLRSYSGFEEPIRRGIINFLTKLKIPFINYNGNIIGLNHPGAPLFSAHMDMVNTESYKLKGLEYTLDSNATFTIDSKACMRLYRDKEKKIQTSLGADDKNGIWVILTMLQMGKEINFAFCHSEEVGGTGSSQIIKDKELAQLIEKYCIYGIIIDRKNAHDIIGYKNNYCLALDDKLQSFSEEQGFKYKCETGSVSDADRFSQLLECVNISCGYYEPHTSREYTNLNELWDTLQFCLCILDRFYYESVSAERMQVFKKISSPYSKYESYSGYYSRYRDSYKRESEKEAATIYSYDSKLNSEKKISKKAKEITEGIGKKTTENTKITTATIMDTTDIKRRAELLLELAIPAGATYDPELGAFIVPLYTSDDFPADIISDDIVLNLHCPNCNRSVFLLQDAVDALYMSYYNGSNKEDTVIGICSECATAQNISEYTKDIA